MPAIGSSSPQTKRLRLRTASFRVSSCRSLSYGSSTTTTRYGGSQELLEGRTRPKFASHPTELSLFIIRLNFGLQCQGNLSHRDVSGNLHTPDRNALPSR